MGCLKAARSSLQFKAELVDRPIVFFLVSDVLANDYFCPTSSDSREGVSSTRGNVELYWGPSKAEGFSIG
jgi:hypothetical protein